MFKTGAVVINGRLYTKAADGYFDKVPLNRHEKELFQQEPPYRMDVDGATGRAHTMLRTDQLLDYMDQAVRSGAVVSRAYQHLDDPGDLRRLVQLPENITVISNDPDGRQQCTRWMAGDQFDTTDPTDMRGVPAGTFDQDYHILDRYVLGQEDERTRYLNFVPGDCLTDPDSNVPGKVSELRVLPVSMLFFDQDEAGEVAPLEDVVVSYIRDDGVKSEMRIRCLDNFTVNRDALSEMPAEQPASGLQFLIRQGREQDEKARGCWRLGSSDEIVTDLTREKLLKAKLAEGNSWYEQVIDGMRPEPGPVETENTRRLKQLASELGAARNGGPGVSCPEF